MSYKVEPDADADLSQQLEIVGATATNLNDLIIIEFDFETTSDEIVFEYVFASLEYAVILVVNLMIYLVFFYQDQESMVHSAIMQ